MINPEQHMTFEEFIRVRNNDGSFTVFMPEDKSIISRIIKHLLYQQQLRTKINRAVQILTCYRPEEYEISMGRSGKSQHTFKGIGINGATDSRVLRTKHMMQESHNQFQVDYFKAMVTHKLSPRRIAFYANGDGDSWFHHDFHKDVAENVTQMFAGMPDGSWKQVQTKNEFINLIRNKIQLT